MLRIGRSLSIMCVGHHFWLVVKRLLKLMCNSIYLKSAECTVGTNVNAQNPGSLGYEFAMITKE